MAALTSFTKTLKEELTCSLCLETFTDPISLPCLHSFCTKCIVECYKKTGNRVTQRFDCPLCKTRIDVPDGDPLKFPSSFYFGSLLQLLTKAVADEPGLSNCVSCEAPQVLIAFCAQCNGLICGKCVDAHKTFKALRDVHQPKMLKDFQEKNVESFIKNQMRCKEKFHDNNKLQYYCEEENCRRCICQKCAILLHQDHRKKSSEEASEDVKTAIRVDMNRAQVLREKYEKEYEKSKKNMARLEKEIEVAKKEVEDTVERICRMTNEHGRAIKIKLDQTLQELRTANNEEQTDIETRIKQVSDFNLYCEKMMERNVAHEIIDSKEVLHDRCKHLVETPSKKSIQCDVTVHYAVTHNITQSLQNIGEVVKIVPSRCTLESPKKGYNGGFVNQFEIITRNEKEQVYTRRKESIDIRIKDLKGNEVKTKVFDEETGKYRVIYKTAEKTGKYEIQVNIGGKRIKNSPHNVDILDIKELFKPVRTFGQFGSGKGELYGPWSIAVIDNTQMAIVDMCNHCIKMFNLEGKYLRECGGEGTGEGRLYEPWGVVYNQNRILVSDSPDNKGRIQEFDLNGTYVRTLQI